MGGQAAFASTVKRELRICFSINAALVSRSQSMYSKPLSSIISFPAGMRILFDHLKQYIFIKVAWKVVKL